MGSLASLPYALAEAEQNFLIPAQTQALIWGDLVPQMILSAKIPRWWNVTPAQMHWVGLHLRYGRELMAEAALDAELRAQVRGSLWRRWPRRRGPARSMRLLSKRATSRTPLDRVTPSELFVAGARPGAQAHAATSSLLLAEMRSWRRTRRRTSTTRPSRALSARPSPRWPIPTSRNC